MNEGAYSGVTQWLHRVQSRPEKEGDLQKSPSGNEARDPDRLVAVQPQTALGSCVSSMYILEVPPQGAPGQLGQNQHRGSFLLLRGLRDRLFPT